MDYLVNYLLIVGTVSFLLCVGYFVCEKEEYFWPVVVFIFAWPILILAYSLDFFRRKRGKQK